MSTESKKTPSEETKKVEGVASDPITEAIEEDDEFEEFEPCRWDAHDEDAEDAQQWQVSQSPLNSFMLSSELFHFREKITKDGFDRCTM